MENNQRCITQEDWCIMPTAKKEKVSSVKKEVKKSCDCEKHIEFIYEELQDLRSKVEKALGRMGL